jgi:hypothetical protein
MSGRAGGSARASPISLASRLTTNRSNKLLIILKSRIYDCNALLSYLIIGPGHITNILIFDF